jgi:hypothetical protein
MEQRAAVDGNTLTGYVAVFNSPSEDFGGFREMLMPSCFDPLPADIPALVNHDDSACIGRTSAGTLTLKADDTGLGYTIALPDITVARDLKVSVERGDLPGCSFGFICLDDDYIGAEDGSVLRVIRSVELIEVSVGVTFPAYTQTSSQVRSLPDTMPIEFRSLIEKRNKPAEVLQLEEEQRLNVLTRIALAEAG